MMTTFKQFADNLTLNGRSPRTIRGYLSDLGTFQTWYSQTYGNDNVLTADAQDLIDYRAYLQNVQRVSAATLNRHIAALRAFYGWTSDNSLTTANTAERLKMKKVQESTAPKSMTEEQLYRLFGAVKRVKNPSRLSRDRAAIYLMAFAGLRVSEACSLRWNDIDFIGKTIRVDGKGDKIRLIPLNDKLSYALTEWQRVRNGYQTSNSEYVLISTRTDKMDATAVQKVIQSYMDSVNLGEFSCHSLRHTCAKRLIDAGVGIERVAAILGHESIETTKRYVRPTQADLIDAINLI